MKRGWIKYMKETQRLKLSFWQTVSHYFIVVCILLIPFFTLISVFEIYVTKTYDGVRRAEEYSIKTENTTTPIDITLHIPTNRSHYIVGKR
ncbi:hypothetical protein EYV94_28360 [Puteibacter caeruleilacunae]|nr:hypothetical protein EYV94_28360 [Puteibacter caeruleilacunae]